MSAGPDPATPPDGIAIEPAGPDDRLDVLRVLDAAMLETDADVVGDRIAAGDALVARFERTEAVVGAVIATRPESGRRHIDAVAVRRARRGRGVGSALVADLVRRARPDAAVDVVTAVFDHGLEGFYADLGFEIDERRAADQNDRLLGRRRVDA